MSLLKVCWVSYFCLKSSSDILFFKPLWPLILNPRFHSGNLSTNNAILLRVVKFFPPIFFAHKSRSLRLPQPARVHLLPSKRISLGPFFLDALFSPFCCVLPSLFALCLPRCDRWDGVPQIFEAREHVRVALVGAGYPNLLCTKGPPPLVSKRL